MSVSFVADKQLQPEPERIQATPSPESPRADHGALCEAMVKTCKTYWDRSLNGVVKHDDSLTAAVSANPGSEGYYILWAFNEGNVSATSVLAHVRIEYEVQFTRPVQVAVS